MDPENIDDGYDGSAESEQSSEDEVRLPESLSSDPAIVEDKAHKPPGLYTLAEHDHTQGFGSFDFTILEHFEAFQLWESEWRSTYWWRPGLFRPDDPKYSNRNLMTVEYQKLVNKNGNQISKPFRFLDLPLEIRERIYSLLLLPIQRPDDQVLEPSMVPQGIRFYLRVSMLDIRNDSNEINYTGSRIRPLTDSNTPSEAGSGDEVVSETHTDSGVWDDFDWDEFDWDDSQPSEEAKSEVDSNSDSWDESFGYKLQIRRKMVCFNGKRTRACPRHPFSKKQPRRKFFPCNCTLQEFADYEFITRLSHVSRQVSREVGTVMWQNAVLEVDALYVLPAFARHHPAALPLIRGLVLPLSYMKWPADTHTDELSAACEFIRRCLELSFLSVNFDTMPDLLQEVLEARKKREWTPILKRLQLSHEFHMIVTLCGRGKMKPPKGSVKRLRALWLPECLSGVTQLEEYCEPRARNATVKEKRRHHAWERYKTENDDGIQLHIVECSKLGLQNTGLTSKAHSALSSDIIQTKNTEDEINEAEMHEVEMNGVEMHEVEMNEVEMNGVEMNGVEMHEVEMNEVEMTEDEMSEYEVNDS